MKNQQWVVVREVYNLDGSGSAKRILAGGFWTRLDAERWAAGVNASTTDRVFVLTADEAGKRGIGY